mgnify:CR=1 FL=1|tara:strand:+ start:54442 stop:54711 length:270 start_codon:yes stop_codon:yes gene_type:complete
MKEKKITVKNKLGLHARAAAKVVTLTNGFKSVVKIRNGDKAADAKSIMKLLMLSAPKGTELIISADGKDEKNAIKCLADLIENKFNENE